MGHDNHTVMSPAHRRNQNPASPSGSLFRRSSTFVREEPDLSWVALFRRHRFLLLMLVLLAFLCTVYLYFAIKFGADSCSGLTGKDETLCRSKELKAKTSHVRRTRRMLLNVQESVFEPKPQNDLYDSNHPDPNALMNPLIGHRPIQSVLVHGHTERDPALYYWFQPKVSLPGAGHMMKAFLQN